jgi:apolipoprotein D and lipocalin family protein
MTAAAVRIAHGIAGLSLAWVPFAAAQAAGELRTVDQVELQKYAGQWYEVALIPNRFQAQCARDTTATYAVRDANTIDVVNRCVRADGRVDAVAGVARVVDTGSGTRLKVSFLPAWLRWLPVGWGDYWIIELAPDYSYAVVGEPGRRDLWILSPTPRLDPGVMDELRQRVRAQGYDPDRLAPSPQS